MGAASSLLSPTPLAAHRLPHLPLVLVHAAAGPGQAVPAEEQLGQRQAPHQLGQHLVQPHLGRQPPTRGAKAELRPLLTSACGPRCQAGLWAAQPEPEKA